MDLSRLEVSRLLSEWLWCLLRVLFSERGSLGLKEFRIPLLLIKQIKLILNLE